jgi:hypothetical protein
MSSRTPPSEVELSVSDEELVAHTRQMRREDPSWLYHKIIKI